MGAGTENGLKRSLRDAEISKQTVQSGAWGNVALSELLLQQRANSASTEVTGPITLLSYHPTPQPLPLCSILLRIKRSIRHRSIIYVLQGYTVEKINY